MEKELSDKLTLVYVAPHTREAGERFSMLTRHNTLEEAKSFQELYIKQGIEAELRPEKDYESLNEIVQNSF